MKPARVALVAVLALVTGVVAGHLLGGSASDVSPAVASPTTTSPSRTVSAHGPGPSGERGGMPAGFSHDEAGARAAAMTYASASQRWLYLDDAGVEAAVAAISTPVAAPRLTREVVDEVRAARESLSQTPGRVWWIVRPLAVDVEAFAPDRARVAVWTVTVLSASDVALPQSDWTTVTLELAWHDDDWRVDEIADAPGPTPMLGPRDQPWQPEPFDDALAGFERVEVGER